jgi:beta-lactamase class A
MKPKYALVYFNMERCANRQRIAAGLKEHWPSVKSCGHKTGSVGAIANDVGIIQFNNGYFAVLAVMTCHSTVRMPVRDDQIAAVTRAIVGEWATEQLLESS